MEKQTDFQIKENPAKRAIRITIIVVALVFGILGFFLLTKKPTVGVIFLLTSAIVGIFPFAIMEYLAFNRFQSMEEKFPLFIRNFAEIKKSGTTFPQALDLASRSDYGPLSREVQKTANQVSWGIPFTKAIDRMADRLKESRPISQALRVINESFSSGGDIAQIMESLSLNIGLIRETYKERKSALSQQSVIMYFIFFAFLGIVVSLYKILIPLITGENGIGALLGSNLGSVTAQNYCVVVPTVCSLGQGLGFSGEGLYFQTLFFLMSSVQAICIGLLTGIITDNKISAGIKHVAVMFIGVIITFMVVL